MKEIKNILNDFKVIVFFDFEGSQFSQEIIAIGAIKAYLDNKNFIKKTSNPFKIYIKINTCVGPFIEKLTGISDDFLNENGVSFNQAMAKFKRFIGKDEAKFFHYGNFDLHLLHNSAQENLDSDIEFIRQIEKNSYDFSKLFSHYVKSNKNTNLSLVDALKVFHTNIEDNLHDPQTDAINLMHLYEAFLTKKGILRDEYIKTLKKSPAIPNAYRKVIKKLESNEKVTYKDFLTYIDEDLR